MKKGEISYDKFVVGLLLKFGSIDVSDISIVMDILGIENFSSINESGFGKYIGKGKNNRYEFNMDMVKRNYECVDDFYPVVHQFQSGMIGDKLDNLDLFEFILRKIKVLGIVKIDDYDENFSVFQLYVIDELKRLGYLNDYFNDGSKATKITKKGILYLFMIEYKNEIDNFCLNLRNLGYNDALIQSYLIAQDIEMDGKYLQDVVFNIENFLEFCSVYDLCPYNMDIKEKEYGRRLQISGNR